MVLEGMGKPPGCKLLRLSADIEAGIIRSIHIRGDFFASPEDGFDRVEQQLAGRSLPELAAVFDTLLREAGVEVFGISGAGVASVLGAALTGSTLKEGT
ncbi:lipoate---protein ligase [Hollandina sp. SP2]